MAEEDMLDEELTIQVKGTNWLVIKNSFYSQFAVVFL